MSNHDEKILLGALLGAIGISALSAHLSSKNKKKMPSLNTLEKTIEHFTAILNKHDIKEPYSKVKKIDEKVKATPGNFSDIFEWLMTGLKLIKKAKSKSKPKNKEKVPAPSKMM
jgi:hypothetical protein